MSAIVLAICAATSAIGSPYLLPAAAALAGLGIGLMLRRPAGDPLGFTDASSTADARVLVRQVLPIWQRTAELARATSERDAETLTQRFATIHSTLELALDTSAAAPTIDGSAIDLLIDAHRAELDRLCADTRAAIDGLSSVMTIARHLDAAAETIARFTVDMQRIARATHILGLNASVEAARSAGSHASFEVVAGDVRELAAQSNRVADLMARETESMRDHVRTLRELQMKSERDDESLALRTEINARATVRSLLSSLAKAVQGSQAMRDAGQLAHSEVEAILMSLQGQDRINQMLHSVISDLGRMRDALDDDDTIRSTSAAEWLQRLEASYTMEEMRSSHHGTKAVAAQAGVEFF